jgi:hypothetical protein
LMFLTSCTKTQGDACINGRETTPRGKILGGPRPTLSSEIRTCERRGQEPHPVPGPEFPQRNGATIRLMTNSLKIAERKTGDQQRPGKTRQKRHKTKKSRNALYIFSLYFEDLKSCGGRWRDAGFLRARGSGPDCDALFSLRSSFFDADSACCRICVRHEGPSSTCSTALPFFTCSGRDDGIEVHRRSGQGERSSRAFRPLARARSIDQGRQGLQDSDSQGSNSFITFSLTKNSRGPGASVLPHDAPPVEVAKVCGEYRLF